MFHWNDHCCRPHNTNGSLLNDYMTTTKKKSSTDSILRRCLLSTHFGFDFDGLLIDTRMNYFIFRHFIFSVLVRFSISVVSNLCKLISYILLVSSPRPNRCTHAISHRTTVHTLTTCRLRVSLWIQNNWPLTIIIIATLRRVYCYCIM